MTKVILDTTTVLDFAKFLNMYKVSDFYHIKANLQENIDILESIENTLEAFILYDEVLIDGKSFFFNFKDENLILSNIANIYSFIDLNNDQEEAIYKRVSMKLKEGKFINEIAESKLNASAYVDYPSLYSDYEADKDNFCFFLFYKNYHNDFLSSINNGKFIELYNNNNLTIKQLFYHVIRCFYYHELQIINSSELVINKKRYDIVQSIFESKKIYTNYILKNFDNEVRKKLYSKERKWLGEGDSSLLMPMVASYLFKKCKSWDDLHKVIIEIKNSKDAILFRKGLSELINAVKAGDLVLINETLSLLDDAIVKWNQNLECNPSKKYRSISLSIPMIGGIGTNIDVPYSWENNISSKLLTFIHKMIINS